MTACLKRIVIDLWRGLAGLAGALWLCGVLSGCSTVPMTNRSQFNLVSDSQMQSMSDQQYREVLGQSQLSTNRQQVEMVRRVGARVSQVTEEFVRENRYNLTFNWEFNVIQDDQQVNAWCMPGGKIAFYSGIMPYCRDDAGIAVVMGHEIAHALARHGSERVSQAMVANLGMTVLSEAMSAKPAETQQMWMAAIGMGLNVGVIMPFSRHQEMEADRIGLILIARAGYDPRSAIEFWQRMAAAGGQKPPEMLSTHPSDSKRIASLQQLMPEALTHYRPR